MYVGALRVRTELGVCKRRPVDERINGDGSETIAKDGKREGWNDVSRPAP